MHDFSRKMYAASTNPIYMWRAKQPYMELKAERNLLQALSTTPLKAHHTCKRGSGPDAPRLRYCDSLRGSRQLLALKLATITVRLPNA